MKSHAVETDSIVGGSEVNPSESTPPPAVFPHLENWETPSGHGLWVVQYGHEPCLKCHKQISVKQENLPTCNTCHSLYPHDSGWVQKERHGQAVLNKGSGTCATQCHGTDLQGGLSGVSCTKCHTVYPHTEQWPLPGEHGVHAAGSKKNLCQGCHGTDFSGGDTGVSCRDCHEEYPHKTGWGSGEVHGNVVLEGVKQLCQKACHGTDLKGGLSGISCDGCHTIYPHGTDWKDKHGGKALELGTGVCQGCHGGDFKKKLGGQTCYSCHEDYPHGEEAKWVPYDGGHGSKVQETHQGQLQGCELCHGTDLKTTLGGKNCYSCHASYPHKKVYGEGWKEYEGHGAYALQEGKEGCKTCHGEKLDGGNRGNVSCTQCHKPYPHGEGWLEEKGNLPKGKVQGHGEYVKSMTSASCGTVRCHGEGLKVEAGVSQGPSCKGCHETYPHEEGWQSGTVHGPVAKASIDVCKGCHGDGLDKPESGKPESGKVPEGYKSCKGCHASYLQHKTAKLGGEGWGSYEGHGKYVPIHPITKKKNPQECQICHGGDYSGGLSGVSCQGSACHGSYPHKENWEKGTTHGIYVIKGLQGDKTACKACHGNDLQGGISTQSCYGCHGGEYPHGGGWKSGEEHGVHVVKDLKGDKGVCKNCHGADLTGGISGVSCKGCHSGEYPHGEGWKNGEVHGIHVLKDLKNDKGVCANCHGADLTGGIAGVSCYSCHSSFTHEGDWKDPTGHGWYVLKTLKNGKSTCQKCHGNDLKGGSAKVSCYGCHSAPYPHEAQWKSPNGHGVYVADTLKGDKSSCKKCHGDDLKGGDSKVSCYGCHAGNYPHDDQWKNPAGHGVYVIETLKGAKNSCKGCHGNDLKGGISKVSCYGCHTGYPHSAGWNQPTSHGLYTLKILKKDISSCKKCHGDDLQGGISKISCFSCHAGVKHDANWGSLSGHGSYVLQTLKNDKSSCKVCHGENLQGGLSAVSCYQCHGSSYPHNSLWKKPENHGFFVLKNLKGNKSVCQKCHGDDLKGGSSKQSCYNSGCHTQYPHEPGWVDWKKHGVQGMASGSQDCASVNCHKPDLKGDAGLGIPSCFTCHPAYPSHVIPAWGPWGSGDHGPYLLNTLKGNKAGCQQCHGDDLKGGITGVSCFNCHPNYPHIDPKWKAMGKESAHAKKFVELMKNGVVSACTECHGSNYDTKLNGTSCTTCHPLGVTHKSVYQGGSLTLWAEGLGHGQYFSSHFTAISQESNCKDCHGAAVAFDDFQTKPGLKSKSDCYGCHWAYPHTGYEVPGYSVNTWEPAVNKADGGIGHIFYLMRSPLFTDSAGKHPSYTDDPILITPSVPGVTPALQYTCGGDSPNNCHFNGYRSTPTGSKSNLCGKYCHSKP